MPVKRAQVTGYFAKRAVSKAMRLAAEVQVDLIGLAVVGGLGQWDAFDERAQKVMVKLQEIIRLLKAALTGDYRDLGLEEPPPENE
jgi:hypothetical protein